MVRGCPKCPCDATRNPLGRSSQGCVQSFRSRVNWCAPFVLGDWEGGHGGRSPFSPIPRPKQQQNPAPAPASAPASVRVESMADGGVGSLRRRSQKHTVLSPEYSPSPARIQSISIKKNGLRPSCAKQNADAQAGRQAGTPAIPGVLGPCDAELDRNPDSNLDRDAARSTKAGCTASLPTTAISAHSQHSPTPRARCCAAGQVGRRR